MIPTTPLPDKLSDLMELALADLAIVEADPRYVVDMGAWHSPDDGKCHVCFAGAVMAGTLNAPIESAHNPSCWDYEDSDKLSALDHVRHGDVSDALITIQGFDWRALDRKVNSYAADPAAWRNDMERIVADLREHGL